jgi:glycosyltransferase involved in cell wall biosynthesis
LIAIDISVVVPCFNDGSFLNDAISSIGNKSDWFNWEIIIVNDGSTDVDTLSILKEIEERGIRVVHQGNLGLATARNNGIAVSRGKYIILLDADNMLNASVFEEAVECLEKTPHVKAVYTDHEILDCSLESKIIVVGEPSIAHLMNYNYIDACAVFRRELFNDVGYYDPDMPKMGQEDWEFWIRLLVSGYAVKYLNKVGFKYRVRNESMIHSFVPDDYEKNKEYIYLKYSKVLPKIFEKIAIELKHKDEEIQRRSEKVEYFKVYLSKHPLRTVVKLIMGRPLLP